jgi:hypothetical protein
MATSYLFKLALPFNCAPNVNVSAELTIGIDQILWLSLNCVGGFLRLLFTFVEFGYDGLEPFNVVAPVITRVSISLVEM